MCVAIQEMIDEGREETREETRSEMIDGMIEILRELGLSEDEVVGRIKAKFNLPDEEIKKHLKSTEA